MKSKKNEFSLVPITWLMLVMACISVWSCAEKTEVEQPPNIVFFFVDDMGWQNTSVPFHTEVTALNKQYRTPNMERLARDGMKFTQAYATAVCSPSRISLMTGINGARHGVTNWTLIKNKATEYEHEKVIAAEWNVNGLQPVPGIERTVHAETLPQLLKTAGYKTIHAGKAHFGAKETPGEDPLNLGFDVNIAGHAAGGPGSYLGQNNFSATWRGGMDVWNVPGLEKYHGEDIFLTEALTVEANKALETAVSENQPFYLYMSHYAVHAPWEIDQRFYQKYIDAGMNEFEATLATMVEGMDKSLGDILDKLDELGVTDNTIIVFMSDNGAPKNTPINVPLRGHKLTPYEGGSRVPLLVKWPDVVNPATVNNQYLIIEDIFPTLLEMAGLEEEADKSVDGKSFMPLLTGNGTYEKDRPIFWHFPSTYEFTPYSAVRKGDWKLIYHHIDRNFELFNLEEDIGETNDLYTTNSEKGNELAKLLSDYLESVSAHMPTDKETGEPVEYPNAVVQ
ncbi:sulfatase [Muricauda sp. 2012CJ35-5]|uniref:Sulfatase n=1 Tax=Flagellimonas spongiicola TaxID=2942208 RepID=A0ABT0PU54_9FLAO|nr:sulfatase [Allomuricauda spongiicola]MCL6274920.1 sulfatase [Allomuricauda spongiicola]